MRVGGGLVAGDDSRPIGSGVGLVAVGGRRPRVGDAAAVRRRGKVEGAAAGLRREPERAASAARCAPPAPPGPDQIRTARSASRRRCRARCAGRASRRQSAAALPGGVCTEPAAPTRDDLGAVAARRLDPEVDDRRALDDRLVAEDDDELARRGSRRAARGRRRARRARRSGRTAACAPSPPRSELRERRRPARRVSEPESAVTIAAAGRAQQPLGLVERVAPSETASKPALAAAHERVGDPVVARTGARTRSGPCRRASPRRPRVVAREDPLDLALARRRA